MNPDTFAELLAEYGSPAGIAAGWAHQEAGAIDDVLLSVQDLRRFELPQEAAEAVSRIAGHLTMARRLMATLPSMLTPAGPTVTPCR